MVLPAVFFKTKMHNVICVHKEHLAQAGKSRVITSKTQEGPRGLPCHCCFFSSITGNWTPRPHTCWPSTLPQSYIFSPFCFSFQTGFHWVSKPGFWLVFFLCWPSESLRLSRVPLYPEPLPFFIPASSWISGEYTRILRTLDLNKTASQIGVMAWTWIQIFWMHIQDSTKLGRNKQG